MRAPWLVLVAAAALPACRSAEAPALPLHPYKVVLLPIEGARAALAERPGDADVPLALTQEELETKIRESVTSSRVFSDVVVARASDLAGRGAEDQMAGAVELARATKSDLILRVQVNSARMTDLGNNGSTFWSTLTWFMVPAPIWTVDDRTYDTDISVRADLFDPADPTRPTASVDAQSTRQDLDLWDRGLSPYVFVVPPAFLTGSAKSVSETLTERAMKQMLEKLVLELRTKKIPTRFEMDVVQEGAAVKVAVVATRRLRTLEVWVEGGPVRTWAETGLAEDGESTAERFVYRRSVEVAAKAGAQVRVIAEDETGGREVRTLVIGGAR